MSEKEFENLAYRLWDLIFSNEKIYTELQARAEKRMKRLGIELPPADEGELLNVFICYEALDLMSLRHDLQ